MKYIKKLELDLIFWPSIIQNENDALENYFILIGTGNEWKKGELVDFFEDYKPFKQRLLELVNCEIKYLQERIKNINGLKGIINKCKPYSNDVKEEVEKYNRTNKKERINILILRTFRKMFVYNVDDDKRLLKAAKLISIYLQLSNDPYPPRIKQTLYPVSEYSPIMKLPDNIKEDWLKAAQKAIYMTEQKEKTQSDKDFLDKAQERINTIKKQRGLL